MTDRAVEPIVIVGSRLQVLIYWISAIAVAAGLWSRFGWPSLVAGGFLFVAGLVVACRRYELGPDGVVVRRIGGTRRAENGSFRAETGHRYLTIDFGNGTHARVEVPVEIRPEVREWAADRGSTPDQ